MRWICLTMLVLCCGAGGMFPSAAQAGAPAPDISTTPALFPAFNQTITDYVVRCTAGTPVQVDVTTPPGTEVRVDGQAPQTGSFTAHVVLSAGESFRIETSAGGTPTGTYHVRCLPADFPNWTFQRFAQPQAEWYVMNVSGATTARYVAIFDTNGVPVWWFQDDVQPTLFTYLPNGNVGWTFLGNQRPEEHRLDGSLVRSLQNVGADERQPRADPAAQRQLPDRGDPESPGFPGLRPAERHRQRPRHPGDRPGRLARMGVVPVRSHPHLRGTGRVVQHRPQLWRRQRHLRRVALELGRAERRFLRALLPAPGRHLQDQPHHRRGGVEDRGHGAPREPHPRERPRRGALGRSRPARAE